MVQDVDSTSAARLDDGIVDERPTLTLPQHLLCLGVGTGEPACIPAAHFVLLGL